MRSLPIAFSKSAQAWIKGRAESFHGVAHQLLGRDGARKTVAEQGKPDSMSQSAMEAYP